MAAADFLFAAPPMWGRPSACGGLPGRPGGAFNNLRWVFDRARGLRRERVAPRATGIQKSRQSEAGQLVRCRAAILTSGFWLRTSDFSTSISFFVDVGAVSAG